MAVAAYEPAESAVIEQVKSDWFAPVPATGPVVEVQSVARPVTPHVIVPVGAAEPVGPVTTAVYVNVVPRVGDSGLTLTEMVGVAFVTVSETGEVAASAE